MLLVPLAVAGEFPQTSTLRCAGPTELVLHHVAGEPTRSYHQLFGNLDLDLSPYYSTPRPTKGHAYEYNSIEIWVGAGNVTVTAPRDEYEYLSGRSASGTITAENGSRHDGSYNANVNIDGQTNSNKALRQLGVNAYVGSGNIRFVEATTGKGATK